MAAAIAIPAILEILTKLPELAEVVGKLLAQLDTDQLKRDDIVGVRAVIAGVYGNPLVDEENRARYACDAVQRYFARQGRVIPPETVLILTALGTLKTQAMT